ncbi:GPI ethanolamine phosphate transferase 3 [Macadamia integrifolia]|uniref:GPI ethanolamine phosphate transferase 3 n=1 Tax=Macadamia integrifolia TaxID=60698 RepID=UPI001C530C41|nr:GPI ethanolamine phosphate transferase 3 [Macadamia integrifolia]
MVGSSIGKWELIWPFFLILILHCVAILFFTRGFLLTRTELSSFSHCADVSHSPCFPHHSPDPSNSSFSSSSSPSRNLSVTDRVEVDDRNGRCWTRPAVDRLVIIVLDALRFDFVAPSTFFDEKMPWMDKLQVLQKLASDERSSARIFKAIADPPTTSLQRLKGLTTGGLPTFIDVGNSFGAPAIVEDNLINQLVRNGKRVLMMGDDTWLQLFPNHFEKSYPFPSFNVKDLHTVDNGCIEHLFPSLYRDDWDVLIAHFLGVDHAGHIFGVDSTPMIEKLEQYNVILEKVIEVLKNQSGPGGLHESTFLLVMGDHGQTLNGDHGGGAVEEVETSLFAMSLKEPPASMPSELDTSTCKLDMNGTKTCFSSIQQLDFAVTIAALLGVPFPFGSIGRVNPELYALSAGTWNQPTINATDRINWSNLEEWLQTYVNILCINSWQVKRYIDVYSASSVIGFPSEDLLRVADIYAQAQDKWTDIVNNSLLSEKETQDERFDASLYTLRKLIDAYSEFLGSVAELLRSKWTEFDLKMMGVGLGIFLFSLFIHFVAIKRATKLHQISFPSVGDSGLSLRVIFALSVVAIRACSFLSNSFILAEGKVANFLLVTTVFLNLRYSFWKKKMFMEAVLFLLLISILRFTVEIGLSKNAVSTVLLKGIAGGQVTWIFIGEIVPMLTLILLGYLLYKTIHGNTCWRILSYLLITGTLISYMLVALHWTLESEVFAKRLVFEGIGRNFAPQVIYAIGFVLLILLVFAQAFMPKDNAMNYGGILVIKTIAMLSVWSSTVIILLGRQGPLFYLGSIVGGWCIIRLHNSELDQNHGNVGALTTDPLPVTQWNLLAVCLFFSSGHWCAFDGLRYGAAFIGFDEFILFRQAILLAVDTFGVSHILPIFGLPFLVSLQYSRFQRKQAKRILLVKLLQVFLIYGLITAMTTMFTIICVTIQRRHLMVWGLFAPKYVFDVIGLILTDALICLASLYYFCHIEDDTPQDMVKMRSSL